MNAIKNNVLNVLSMLLMAFFAIPKLLSVPQSKEGFIQFENAIHIDADFFRIFTGISELGLALLILVFIIKKNKNIGKLAFAFLLVTMVTALGLEFFARPEPKMVLVIIAIVLAAISIFKLKTIK